MKKNGLIEAGAIVIVIGFVLLVAWWAFSVGVASEHEWNCNDFRTRSGLEAFVSEHPNDPYRLDSNKDGVPCENITTPR